MFNWLFGEKSNTQIGIDLGSSSIKIVELGQKDERTYLINYALAQVKAGAVFSVIDLKDEEIVKILKELIAEAKISGRYATVSLPVEKTFSTVITLPVMPASELAAAVSFEAQKYVPVPLEEVVLDWTVISGRPGADVDRSSSSQSPTGLDAISETGQNSTSDNLGTGTIQILLLAVPKETINRVANIVSQAGLKVAALEQEAFSLARSLIGNDKNTFMVIDLGRRGTDIIVLDQGFIKLSHNLESINKEIILMEIDRVVNIFQMRYNKKIGQCLLAGGRANEKELIDFLSAKLKIPVKVGDPFARVGHDQKVAGFLKELAPQMAVAAGLAMREN